MGTKKRVLITSHVGIGTAQVTWYWLPYITKMVLTRVLQ